MVKDSSLILESFRAETKTLYQVCTETKMNTTAQRWSISAYLVGTTKMDEVLSLPPAVQKMRWELPSYACGVIYSQSLHTVFCVHRQFEMTYRRGQKPSLGKIYSRNRWQSSCSGFTFETFSCCPSDTVNGQHRVDKQHLTLALPHCKLYLLATCTNSQLVNQKKRFK